MLEHLGHVNLDSTTAGKIASFHSTVFGDVLKLGEDAGMKMAGEESGEVMVCPLNRG